MPVFLLPKSSAILKSHTEYGICRLFKYASDFIWWLGKNDLDSLVAPVAAFFSFGARTHKECLFSGCLEKVKKAMTQRSSS
jgi:hypothetical protein